MKKLLALVAIGLFAAASTASACGFHEMTQTSKPTTTALDSAPITPKPTTKVGG
jgi:hypothetical protein